MAKHKLSAREQLLVELETLRGQGLRWRDIGQIKKVAAGTLCRIYNQPTYEPHASIIRARLGLPLMGQAPVCAKCQRVHVTSRCTPARRRLTFTDRCAAWDAWLAEHRTEIDERVRLIELTPTRA